ncbi:lipocalin family protein [Flavobacterium sp.]|uniref:lipocalin family protein n=1 Tax=Flavobacterium sp. TaxID=239 RepID=UPI00262C9796|nr:lipocalin family protein [Flavobacterium sp.]
MKNTITLFLSLLLLVSCNQSITDKDIAKLNGYWEIKKVVLKDGEKKDYKINETIDYFQLKDKKGFRQKVMPQLDGTYKTNNLKEEISISNENDSFFVNYSTSYGKWKEEIIEIQDSVLVLKNKDDLEYNYKRYQPFSLK